VYGAITRYGCPFQSIPLAHCVAPHGAAAAAHIL